MWFQGGKNAALPAACCYITEYSRPCNYSTTVCSQCQVCFRPSKRPRWPPAASAHLPQSAEEWAPAVSDRGGSVWKLQLAALQGLGRFLQGPQRSAGGSRWWSGTDGQEAPGRPRLQAASDFTQGAGAVSRTSNADLRNKRAAWRFLLLRFRRREPSVGPSQRGWSCARTQVGGVQFGCMSFHCSAASHYLHMKRTQEWLNIITWRLKWFMYDFKFNLEIICGIFPCNLTFYSTYCKTWKCSTFYLTAFI